jgi:hypothetical protein
MIVSISAKHSPAKRKKKRKSKLARSQRWVRPLHAYSSMLMLFILLFFTLTGLTLNNRQWLPTPSLAETVELPLPTRFAVQEQALEITTEQGRQQGEKVWAWLQEDQNLPGGELSVEWLTDESLLLLDIKRPGGYTTVEVALNDAIVMYEHQSLGWMAIVNDLHMGRYSGKAWSWFIDITAIVVLLFTLTGFWLVLFHPKRRSRTLILSGAGTLLMIILYLGILA